MRLALLAFIAACVAFAQGPDVAISPFPANNPAQKIYNYTGTNLTSVCWAKSNQLIVSLPISISAASNANPVSFTSTAHGFNANSRPKIIIIGGTGNWTVINLTTTATITGANTFTIPVDSTSLGALTGTITFTTFAPRTNQPVWSVQQNVFDASSNIIWSGFLNGSTQFQAKCSDATSTTLNVQ